MKLGAQFHKQRGLAEQYIAANKTVPEIMRSTGLSEQEIENLRNQMKALGRI